MPRAPEAPRPRGLRERVPLAPLTTLGVGGPARWLLEAGSVEEVADGVAWAGEQGLPLFVLGGGSNLVVADGGFPGLVLAVALRGVAEETAGDGVLLRAGAGEPWDPLVERTVAAALGGLECLSGIPGSAGATPIQNVGAYGQEVAESILEVEALSRESGAVRRFGPEACGFGYRDSAWKHEERDRWVILGVTFRLRPGAPPAVRYPELARALNEEPAGEPDLARVRATALALRRRKGMVLDPTDSDTRSDGSFFMNPVVPPAAAEQVLERAVALSIPAESVPRWPGSDGVKLSAAWLIERSGLVKGHRHGGVGISSKHSLAIVNRGGGTAAEVVELAGEIRRRVSDVFGVTLVPEPTFVGFDGDPLAGSG